MRKNSFHKAFKVVYIFIVVESKVHNILSLADIRVNGNRPWDIKVNDQNFYSRVLAGGSLALGETYMDGLWECKRPDELIYRILRSNLDKKIKISPDIIWNIIKASLFNMQSRNRAFEVGERHYDIGNDLYEAMLDKRMIYTCGYWKNAKTLNKAQEDKLDLVCRKIGLKKGMSVLDIGCGWGGFAKFAAEKYKANVVGITISREQAKLAERRCKGLPVKILLKDYRSMNGKFDRIVSLGMFEHVGAKNYREYMKVANRCLKEDGLFILHTIGRNKRGYDDPWITKYIFPNGEIPTASQIAKAYEQIFVMEDWHNFGQYYDKTLLAWESNFRKNWDNIKSNYSERFRRMWRYYLLSCAGAFRARRTQLWQIVFSKKGVLKEYNSIR